MKRYFIAIAALLLMPGVSLAAGSARLPAGKYMLELVTSPAPPVAGENQFIVTVTDQQQPATGLGAKLHLDMVGMSMPADVTASAGAAPGQYVATVNLSMAGKWRATVSVQQMPGMSMPGDGQAEFLIETGKGVTASSGPRVPHWAAILIPVLLVLVAAALIVRAGRRARGPVRGVIVGVLTLAVVLVVTVLIVRKYRNPMVSTVVGSALMDMESMKAPASAVAVLTETVRPAPFQAAVAYTGTVAPDLEEDIYPRVMGRLAYMPLYPGDRVRAGQVVARLDAQELTASAVAASGGVRAAESDLRASRESAREADSAVAAARAAVTEAESGVATAQADVEYWRDELAREQRLYKVGAVSKEELDRETSQAAAANAKLAQAQAGVERSRQEVAQAVARRAATRAAVVSAQAKLSQARAMQSGASTVQGYTELRASRDGVVTARNVSPGVVVQPGTSVLTIAKADYVRLQVSVAEADLASIRIGQQMTARRAGDGGVPVSARVTAIFPAQDPTTRTAIVEARIPNPDGRLKLGQYLSVTLDIGGSTAPVISIPNSALISRGGQTSVFVVNDDGARTVVRRVVVTTARAGNARTEISSGLQPGDRVIISGPGDLNDGDAVTVTTAAAGTSATH